MKSHDLAAFGAGFGWLGLRLLRTRRSKIGGAFDSYGEKTVFDTLLSASGACCIRLHGLGCYFVKGNQRVVHTK